MISLCANLIRDHENFLIRLHTESEEQAISKDYELGSFMYYDKKKDWVNFSKINKDMYGKKWSLTGKTKKGTFIGMVHTHPAFFRADNKLFSNRTFSPEDLRTGKDTIMCVLYRKADDVRLRCRWPSESRKGKITFCDQKLATYPPSLKLKRAWGIK